MPFDTLYLAAYGAEELRNYYFQGYGEKRRLLKVWNLSRIIEALLC